MILHVKTCARCADCKLHGYQTLPLLCIGRADAKVLVISELEEITDEATLALADLLNFRFEKRIFNPLSSFSLFYEFDLERSRAGKMMSQVFGPGWMRTNNFLYTTTVRCRLPEGRSIPSDMVMHCAKWTLSLLHGMPLVITFGKAAIEQLAHIEKTTDVPFSFKHIAYPHYSTWSDDEIDRIKIDIAKYLEEFDVHY